VRPEVSLERMVTARLISFALILALGMLVLSTILLEVGLAVVENVVTRRFEILVTVHAFQNLNRGISFLVLTLLFAALFKFLPDVRIGWKDVVAGAFFTALALTVSKFLISWFLSTAHLGSAYGAMGSVIIFLFWLYLNIQIFLFGAEFTEALACANGAPIRPAEYAIWLPGRTPVGKPPAKM
ncbi:MAG TPA: YihY/virulence factor BrkB family protein, partial [Candidatus Obscuribacterales bacterium]